nr:zinc finger, CCHC-type [Tanacetum cinerariifolium]
EYRQVKVVEFFDCPGPRKGVEDLRELLHKQRVKRMASMNTRLNIEKLDGNIVQKHGGLKQLGSKQVGFKQLGVKQVGFKQLGPDKHGLLGKGAGKGVSDWVEDQDGLVCPRFLGRGYNQVYISSEYVTIISDWIEEACRYVEVFCWLASIKQGILELVKVKCIFMGYHKSIVGNKLWRLDDITSNVVLYMNMSFNESGKYKKTFIGSGVGTGSMQVLHRFEFEVKPLGDHTFEVEPRRMSIKELVYKKYREDNNEAAFVVAAVEKIYAHESLTFNNTVSCEVISKWKAGLKDDMDARSDVYVLSNGYRKCSNDSDGYYWVQTLLEGHFILSLEGSLSGDCDVEKNDVGMLDGFDRELQTYVQVFVNFDYAMGRSITRYRFMILGCAGSLKSNLQHMEALSTTKAGYMTFTEAWKKKAIWLRGLLEELGADALTKVVPGHKLQHCLELLSVGIG